MRPPLAALLCVLALTGCESGDDDADRPAPVPTPIDRQVVLRHLRALQRIADRDGGTRAAGTPGYRDSARYVARTLRAAGWSVRVQSFRYPGWAERSSALEIAPRGALRPGRDFRPAIYSGDGDADGPLRAVGNGCTPEELAGIRPGEVALAQPAGCLFRVKAANARDAGAAALLIGDPTRARRGASAVTLVAPGARLPVAIVRRALAERLRGGSRVRMRVRTESGERTSVNVIGQSPGGGPRVVMAGAHLDSVPAGPGINDNGSGVAALLALAESTGSSPAGVPLRVGFWGVEEFGLHGSRRYVRSLGAQVRDIGAYLNLDMVGSPNPVRAVYGAGQARPAARRGARRIARLLRARVRPKETTGGASDHVPFATAGVPVGGVFTGAYERGPGGRPRDPCYHLACDRLANVNVRELVALARATKSTLAVLARQAK